MLKRVAFTSRDQDRFLAKIVAGNNGCCVRTSSLDRHGYGRFSISGSAGRSVGSHRISYRMFVGPIPDGLTIDHLCRNRACVRPDHLEPVTNQENLRRGLGFGAINAAKTHCPKGHPYDTENTRWESGKRHCRSCNREWVKAQRARG